MCYPLRTIICTWTPDYLEKKKNINLHFSSWIKHFPSQGRSWHFDFEEKWFLPLLVFHSSFFALLGSASTIEYLSKPISQFPLETILYVSLRDWLVNSYPSFLNLQLRNFNFFSFRALKSPLHSYRVSFQFCASALSLLFLCLLLTSSSLLVFFLCSQALALNSGILLPFIMTFSNFSRHQEEINLLLCPNSMSI